MGKISLTNIAEELAAKSGLGRDASDNFVRAIVETIERGLYEDNIVKIKGLGTFKLLEVSERGSVDINTGERITIKGHRKVSFTPDSAMKEFVNRPFAHFEPTELNDGYPDEEVTDDDNEGEAPEAILEPQPEEPVAETLPELQVEEPAAETLPELQPEESVAEILPEPQVEEPVAEALPELQPEEPAAEALPEPQFEEPVAETLPKLQPEEPAAEALPEPQPEEQELFVVVDDGESTEEVSVPVDTQSDDTGIADEAKATSSVEPMADGISTATESDASVDTESSQEGKTKRNGYGWLVVIVLLVLVGGIYYRVHDAGISDATEYDVEVEEYDNMTVNPNLGKELSEDWNEQTAKETTPSIAKLDSVPTEQEIPAKAIPSKPEAATEPAPEQALTIPLNIAPTESLAAKSVKDITVADTTDYIISGTLVAHELKSGETIVQLARKYYGDKRLWPYIVKHNAMKDFNNVAIGQTINIPLLKQHAQM